MPSVVQALASMLSAGADASSRVAAAGLGANAHVAAANAGLQGDMYRVNSTNQLGNRSIDSQDRQFQAEQFLRSALANQQFGLQRRELDQQGQYQTGQLGLQRDQLGLQREQMGMERDLKLGELGQGPYAPKMPNFDDLLGGQQAPAQGGVAGWLKSLFGGGAQSQGGTSMEIAKRMIASRNPQLMQQGMALLQHAESQARQQQELDFKQQTTKSPLAYLPYIAQMEGVNPQNINSILENIMRGGGGDGASLSPPSIGLAEAAGVNADPATANILKALGVNDTTGPLQLGDAIGSRAGSLTPQDLAAIQNVIAARMKSNPKLLDSVAPDHPGAQILRKLLGSSAASLRPDQLFSDYETQRKSYYQKRGPEGKDPRDLIFGGMFGLPF
jgi:hypothetical protein